MTAPSTERRLFPCFIAVDDVPPLVIGNAGLLEAKIRLLLKFAPAVDLVTDLRPAARLSSDRRVRAVTGVSCQMAHDLIAGRPLVILDTLDPVLNVALAATARDAGVPVNVPDNPALCSAYLGAIVDRSPVLVAISTAGVAPVLGQRIRARIETMLPAGFGRLATYLDRHRASLRALSPARRRAIQHHLVDGRAADHIIAGDDTAADRLLARLVTTADENSAAPVKIVDIGGGDPGLLSLHGVETIRNADIIVHQADVAPAITDLTRREAGFVTVPPGLGGAQVRSFVDDLCMGPDGERIVLLLPTGPTPAMTAVVRHLLDSGHCDAVIPAARPAPVVARDLPHGPATDTIDDTGPGPGLGMSLLRHRQGQPAGRAR
jgi:siroheme synthase-like protein